MSAVDLALPAPRPALTRTRRLATAVLGLMTAVFAATHAVPDTTIARLLRSMAEAGMVGGVADWFAVEALFRHPFGLPIPHTALLPKNQVRAARNVSRFFETYFLRPDSLEVRLRAFEPGRHTLAWLAHSDHATLVARELTGLLGHLLVQEPSPRTLARLRRWLRSRARGAEADAAIAEGLARLVKDGVRGAVVGEVLTAVRQAIDENREVAVALVQDQSRWWIASAVDRRLAGLIVDGVLSLIDALGDEETDLRRDFQAGFDRMVDALATGGALTRAVGEGRRALVRSGTLEKIVFRLAAGLRDHLRDRIAADPEALAVPGAELIRDLATRALADTAARAQLDARIAEVAARLIGAIRPAISAYVADVITSWEPAELNARFEAEIGPDLQYIRVNGAVLGALVGGGIFGLNMLLG
ncbi:MAG: DUF445 domain-containing protein [Acetobacteraceae bacterium]|nr:DUF445 domain-containing protein [Acetobacteraceae bacterium]